MQVESDLADWDADQQLMGDLFNDLYTGAISVEKEPGKAPPGASKMGAVDAIASILLGGFLSAAGLRAFSNIVVAYLRRTGVRRVTMHIGEDVLVLEAASRSDVRAVLNAWLAKHGLAENAASDLNG